MPRSNKTNKAEYGEKGTLSMDEASALMDKHAAEDAAKEAAGKPAKVKKAKSAIERGAKQGRSGLNAGASRQLKLLDEEGY